MVDKIREVSRYRIYGDKIYQLEMDDVQRLNDKIKDVFERNSDIVIST